MERAHISNNLHRIVALAERMHIPGSAERIVDLARNALHVLDGMDLDKAQLGLIVSALAQSVEPGAVENSIRITDPNLFRWAASESLKRHPKEPEQQVRS